MQADLWVASAIEHIKNFNFQSQFSYYKVWGLFFLIFSNFKRVDDFTCFFFFFFLPSESGISINPNCLTRYTEQVEISVKVYLSIPVNSIRSIKFSTQWIQISLSLWREYVIGQLLPGAIGSSPTGALWAHPTLCMRILIPMFLVISSSILNTCTIRNLPLCWFHVILLLLSPRIQQTFTTFLIESPDLSCKSRATHLQSRWLQILITKSSSSQEQEAALEEEQASKWPNSVQL